MLELCQERGHLGNATAQNLELGLGTFGNVDLGRFGKDTWLSLGKSIPRGSRWSRNGEERLFPDPRGSQAPAGICPEQFWDWDLSTGSALVPLEQGQSGAILVSGKLQQGGLAGSGMS